MKDIKKIIPVIVIVCIVGAIGFYVGTKYGGNKWNVPTNGRMQLGGQNLRQGGGNAMMGQRGQGGGFLSGEIISKDATTITVKLGDGGSKIVFLSSSTPVMKSVQGSSADLLVGENVMITGTTNSDGSVTAGSVQLRIPLSTVR
ncbi:MAG: hypothetical protein AB1333_01795 [Patescibacteria group bacterium]